MIYSQTHIFFIDLFLKINNMTFKCRTAKNVVYEKI